MHLFSFNILLACLLVTIAVIAVITGFAWKDKGMGCSHCSAPGGRRGAVWAWVVRGRRVVDKTQVTCT